MLIPLYSHCYTPTSFSPQGAILREYDTFREQGQQNTRPDVNIRLKSSVFMLRGSCDIWWQLFMKAVVNLFTRDK